MFSDIIFCDLFQRLLSLYSLLPLHLIVVELREVVDNDGDGERHYEHPGDGAAGADQLAQARGGVDVSVADRGHRDDRPPEAGGDGGEARVLLVLLGEVAERGEDEDAHEDEEQEETELLAAVPECEGEGLGGRGMRVSVNAETPNIMETVTLGRYQNC